MYIIYVGRFFEGNTLLLGFKKGKPKEDQDAQRSSSFLQTVPAPTKLLKWVAFRTLWVRMVGVASQNSKETLGSQGGTLTPFNQSHGTKGHAGTSKVRFLLVGIEGFLFSPLKSHPTWFFGKYIETLLRNTPSTSS